MWTCLKPGVTSDVLHAMWTDGAVLCNVEGGLLTDVIAYRKPALVAVRPVRTGEPGQSRKCLLRIIARLKARHPDPIRPMLVAASALTDMPTTERSVTRAGRTKRKQK